MEARKAGSSRAAEAFEEAAVVADDPGDVRRDRRRIPHIPLERPAKDDPVGARKHVAEAAKRCVANLRLRLEDRELAANRLQLLVAEQLARAETGAVENEVLAKRSHIGRRRQPADLDLA